MNHFYPLVRHRSIIASKRAAAVVRLLLMISVLLLIVVATTAQQTQFEEKDQPQQVQQNDALVQNEEMVEDVPISSSFESSLPASQSLVATTTIISTVTTNGNLRGTTSGVGHLPTELQQQQEHQEQQEKDEQQGKQEQQEQQYPQEQHEQPKQQYPPEENLRPQTQSNQRHRQLISHQGDWFHVISTGGKWTTKRRTSTNTALDMVVVDTTDGFFETSVRYDMNTNDKCHLSSFGSEEADMMKKDTNEQGTTKSTTFFRTLEDDSTLTTHYVTDSTYMDITLKEDALLFLNVTGWVSQQIQRNTHLDRSRSSNNDVLNIYVDGNWIYQTTGRTTSTISSSTVCTMGPTRIGRRDLPSTGMPLSKGVRYFAIEVVSDVSSYHVDGYYEIDFIFQPQET